MDDPSAPSIRLINRKRCAWLNIRSWRSAMPRTSLYLQKPWRSLHWVLVNAKFFVSPSTKDPRTWMLPTGLLLGGGLSEITCSVMRGVGWGGMNDSWGDCMVKNECGWGRVWLKSKRMKKWHFVTNRFTSMCQSCPDSCGLVTFWANHTQASWPRMAKKCEVVIEAWPRIGFGDCRI